MPQRLLLFAEGARAIRASHDKGACLGYPAPGTMAVDASGIMSFLGFEESSREVMAKLSAQARDWMVYCVSTLTRQPEEELALAAASCRPAPFAGKRRR